MSLCILFIKQQLNVSLDDIEEYNFGNKVKQQLWQQKKVWEKRNNVPFTRVMHDHIIINEYLSILLN